MTSRWFGFATRPSGPVLSGKAGSHNGYPGLPRTFMSDGKQPRKRERRSDLSLHPLPFEEVVADLLQVKKSERQKPKKRARKV
jgi:hypothetical protein